LEPDAWNYVLLLQIKSIVNGQKRDLLYGRKTDELAGIHFEHKRGEFVDMYRQLRCGHISVDFIPPRRTRRVDAVDWAGRDSTIF